VNTRFLELTEALLVLAVAVWLDTPALAADGKKITLSYSAVSMTWFPVKVAVEKGFFATKAWRLN
jgi:hypothetical protein